MWSEKVQKETIFKKTYFLQKTMIFEMINITKCSTAIIRAINTIREKNTRQNIITEREISTKMTTLSMFAMNWKGNRSSQESRK